MPWLEDLKFPRGYQMGTHIKIYVSESNRIRVDNGLPQSTDVKVENKSGSLLPSTGGMGTTLIYLIGGALVLGSGFVLVNKKRAKAK